jgi:hypothetical protein
MSTTINVAFYGGSATFWIDYSHSSAAAGAHTGRPTHWKVDCAVRSESLISSGQGMADKEQPKCTRIDTFPFSPAGAGGISMFMHAAIGAFRLLVSGNGDTSTHPVL